MMDWFLSTAVMEERDTENVPFTIYTIGPTDRPPIMHGILQSPLNCSSLPPPPPPSLLYTQAYYNA